MTLRAGDLILGRFEILGALPSPGDLVRYAARDTATGQEVEVHQPAPQAQIRPGARERFRDAHRSLPNHPAITPPLSAGEHQGRPVSARPSAAPFPGQARLSAEAVAALAAWLLPAIRLADAALGETLRPHDLVVLPSGEVRLQPAGLVAHRSGAVPDPFLPPTPEQGPLYGLGVILFSVATGEPPFSARTPNDLRRQQQHPPRPRAIRPDLPAALDDLIAGLLSPDPDERRAAAERIPAASHSPRLTAADLAPPSTTRRSTATEVAAAVPSTAAAAARTPSSVPLAVRRDLALSEWVVVADVVGAPESMVRRLAALLEVPEAVLREAVRQEVPVPIAGGSTEAAARAEAARLAIAGVSLSVERASRRRPGLVLLGSSALVVSVLAGVLGMGAFLFGAPLALLLTLATLAALAAVVGVGGVVSAGLGSGVPRALTAGHQILHSRPGTLPAPSPLEAELAATRRALLQSELPEPARVDLLTAVDDLQAALPDVDGEPEIQRVRQALTDITAAAHAARATPDATATAQTAEDAARRARAAQLAARELRH